MDDSKPISRREFSLHSALAILSGVAITVSCASDSPTDPTPTPDPGPGPGPDPDDLEGTVSANHGHEAVITDAELTAGNMLSLDIRGTADHPHTVELTADEVMRIADDETVAKLSSNNDAHTHTVTFN